MAQHRASLDGGPVRRDPLSLLEIGFAIVGVMFMTGGLLRVIDPRPPIEYTNSTSPAVQIVGALVYLFAGLLIGARYKAFLPIIARSAFVFLPVLIAFASTQWSVEPDVTLRRSIALLGTVLFAIYLGGRFRPRELALILFVALSAITVMSFLAAVLMPRFGIHQADDGVQEHHAGLWRGVFLHKNALGPAASTTMLVTLSLWRLIPAPQAAKAGVVAVGAVTVVMTGSATGLVLAVLFCTGAVFHRQLVALPPLVRVAGVPIALGVALFAIFFADQVLDLVLGALGRSRDMSSRDVIWQIAVAAGSERPLLGGGYAVGWLADASTMSLRIFWRDVGHAHNGLLTTWLDIGVVGVASLIPIWTAFVTRTLAIADLSEPLYIFSLYFFLLYIAVNFSDSAMFEAQDVFCLLVVALVVMNGRLIVAAGPPLPTALRRVRTRPLPV